MKHKFYSPEMEYRKDRTPSTGAFVWVPVAFLMLCLLCRVDAVAEPRHSFDNSDCLVVVAGVCL